MRIIVISDTHRSLLAINKLSKIVSELVPETDILIHLGDNVEDIEPITKLYSGRSISVRGNCDLWSKIPLEKTELLENKKIFITHGHKYGVKYGLSPLIGKAKELGVDIVLYGHTHFSRLEMEEGIWFINPGSPSMARDGFMSYAQIDIIEDKIVPIIKAL